MVIIPEDDIVEAVEMHETLSDESTSTNSELSHSEDVDYVLMNKSNPDEASND